MSDFYEVEDYQTMTFRQVMSDEQIQFYLKEQESVCSFCNAKEGYMLKCLKKNCKLVSHAYCM